MSAPTRQFHRLSIGHNMSESRAQSTRTDRAAGRPLPPAEDESEREEDSSEEESGSEESEEESSDGDSSGPSTIQRPGVIYDVSSLDGETRASALVGLRSQFDVVNYRATDSGYDFQLLDRPLVHLEPNSTTCSCSTFQARPQAACQHIFWVLDQLHASFLPNPSTAQAPSSRDNRPEIRLRIEDIPKRIHPEAAAERLDWQCLRDGGDGGLHGMTRTGKVRDVLSAFSPKVLPEDFRQDLSDTTTPKLTAEQCVVQGDFETTMFRLALHDDSVFSSLCKAMPSGACAAIYFDKIYEDCRRLLLNFDQYCATGQRPTDPTSPGGGIVEVDEVVERLRRAVSRIHSNILTRSPHGSDGAAKALIWILETTANRNKDPLVGNNWGRKSFHGEDEDQRNLYHLLIDSEEMASKPDDELFVLSALADLPPLALYPRIGELRNALRKIEVNRAPKNYLLQLGALIRTVEGAGAAGAGSSAMGSGQKRPAVGGSGNYSKRSR